MRQAILKLQKSVQRAAGETFSTHLRKALSAQGTPRWAKIGQDVAREGPRHPKTAKDSSKTAPGQPQDNPRQGQDSPRRPQNSTKRAIQSFKIPKTWISKNHKKQMVFQCFSRLGRREAQGGRTLTLHREGHSIQTFPDHKLLLWPLGPGPRAPGPSWPLNSIRSLEGYSFRGRTIYTEEDTLYRPSLIINLCLGTHGFCSSICQCFLK